MKKIIACCLSAVLLCSLASCHKQHTNEYARFSDDTYFVGTNFWYGAILASTGVGGDRDRLARELDAMQAVGINNLRVLVGADGLSGVEAKIEPTLQWEPGVYNDTLLDGLDYLMAELGKRHMYAVLFINNAWEWSGGYSQYLSWAKGEHWPTPQEVGYPQYMASCAEWSRCKEAQELYFNHVRFLLGRTNRYTDKPYTEDPAIFSWQIGNEPRAFSMEVADEFAEWIHASAKLIKELDPNHMVSTGSEGIWGCEGDSVLCRRIHEFPEVDYMTCHIWPFNWGWMDGDWQSKVGDYIQQHMDIAERINKPFVIEEFGFPRDLPMWPGTPNALHATTMEPRAMEECPTSNRNMLYAFIFDHVKESASQHGYLRGCNFWGWGGEAVPVHQQWLPGDPYTGDPAQEDQGLNSVFACDTTMLELIKTTNSVFQSNF